MSEEILINVTPPETRVAVIENGVLQELIIERTRERGLVGNIYKGEVCRVLPGMQAAFVDIGLPKAAFIHISDLCAKDIEEKASDQIEHYLREGQYLVVQVVKDPLGSKGARLTTEISIPSRYQVYMPYSNSSGVSQRIEIDAERLRLRACLDGFRLENNCGGFIARTAAECVPEAVLVADMTFLLKLWESILKKIVLAKSKQFIHKDLPLSIRTLRDLYKESLDRVRVDSRETYNSLLDFAEVNKGFIRTFGDNAVHVSEIDYFVEHISSKQRAGDADQLGRKRTEPGNTEKRIAEYVGSLIKDGDTLQVGVGSASECIALNGILDSKVDLGWHSETTPPGIIKLVREGVITGKHKKCNTGKFIAIASTIDGGSWNSEVRALSSIGAYIIRIGICRC